MLRHYSGGCKLCVMPHGYEVARSFLQWERCLGVFEFFPYGLEGLGISFPRSRKSWQGNQKSQSTSLGSDL